MEKKCRFCSRVCHKQEHLDRHERTHTKVRPYRCEACEKHFVRRYAYPFPRLVRFSTNSLTWCDDSDTLKRHQKLHLAEAEKASKRSVESVKRSSGGDSDASLADISLREPPLVVDNQSAVEDPKLSVEQVSATMELYALDVWGFTNFGSVDTFFPGRFGGKDRLMDNLFEDHFEPLDESSIGSLSTDHTVNPGDIWGSP